ncbi:hypothetical protein FIBSPDRAFT_1044583 [Athelia psychrophila]|uniref:Fe2OG dioxygenase domain-containing protein n=1 Tax=Athelia psychrophila TaxID=1759441 RepID=A0A166JEX9_9AGAM|nr:hypothetical protein FIBSPDRAFT_1044583 [Fibularhizoctonia sp. CBS 109695]
MLSTTVPTDPTSPAYKKALRQHLKSANSRDRDVELAWTPFRAAEKKYKARFPAPNLAQVLDLTISDACKENGKPGGWHGNPDAVEIREVLPKEGGDQKAYIVPCIPGLVFLPSFLSPTDQKRLIRWALCDHAKTPNETNLDAHYVLPEDGLWNAYIRSKNSDHEEALIQPHALVSPDRAIPELPGPRKLVSNTPASLETFEALSITPKPPPPASSTARPTSCSSLIRKLRWANIGWNYHWGTKHYDFSKGPGTIDPQIRDVCRRAVELVDWNHVFGGDSHGHSDWGPGGPDWDTWTNTYEPDAGIVNFYQEKDTLMAHVDRSEVCATSPLVSISLGHAAVFLIGGLTRDSEPVPILLRSGDVVIMSGPECRRAYHGVPRILEGTLPPHFAVSESDTDWTEDFEEFMRGTRINVNVRQVFPKGFDPGA